MKSSLASHARRLLTRRPKPKSDEVFERICIDVESVLSPEDVKEIKSFWRHGEPELAFEGLVTSLRRADFPNSTELTRDLAYLAHNFEDEEYADGKGVYW